LLPAIDPSFIVFGVLNLSCEEIATQEILILGKEGKGSLFSKNKAQG